MSALARVGARVGHVPRRRSRGHVRKRRLATPFTPAIPSTRPAARLLDAGLAGPLVRVRDGDPQDPESA